LLVISESEDIVLQPMTAADFDEKGEKDERETKSAIGFGPDEEKPNDLIGDIGERLLENLKEFDGTPWDSVFVPWRRELQKLNGKEFFVANMANCVEDGDVRDSIMTESEALNALKSSTKRSPKVGKTAWVDAAKRFSHFEKVQQVELPSDGRQIVTNVGEDLEMKDEDLPCCPPYQSILARTGALHGIVCGDSVIEAELLHVKKYFNDGFGIPPVFDAFTAPKKPNPRPSPPLPDCNASIVLCTATHHGGDRVSLFQAKDIIVGSGECISTAFAAGRALEVVISIENGEDCCIIVGVLPIKLTPLYPEAPLVGVVRRVTTNDRRQLQDRRAQESRILRECKLMVRRGDVGSKIKEVMTVQDVELQLDGSRLIVFIKCKEKVNWNRFSTKIWQHVKARFKLQTRVWFQRHGHLGGALAK